MTARTVIVHACLWLLISMTVHACVSTAEHVRQMNVQQWEGYP